MAVEKLHKTIEHTPAERAKMMKHYWDKTMGKRDTDKIPADKIRYWKKYLSRETARALTYQDQYERTGKKDYKEYVENLHRRIRGRWWDLNHRYAANKNRQRTSAKNFILKKASYQDLYKVKEWVKVRHDELVAKAKLTMKRNRRKRKNKNQK